MTLSSKFPFAAHQVTVASLPMTRAQTCITLSQMTGFTLPGMIELPGCVSGSRISPMPQRGPLPSQRMSLAILKSETAIVLSWPLAWTSPSFAALRFEMIARFAPGDAGLILEMPHDDAGKIRMAIQSGADGGAADRQFLEGGDGVAGAQLRDIRSVWRSR